MPKYGGLNICCLQRKSRSCESPFRPVYALRLVGWTVSFWKTEKSARTAKWKARRQRDFPAENGRFQ